MTTGPQPHGIVSTIEVGTGGGRRILLVEDHLDTAVVFARILRLQGYEVTVAYTFAEVLGLADVARFELLLSDISLPDGDGCKLYQAIVQRGFSGKAIALTASGTAKDIQRCLDAGYSKHLLKPVTLDVMLATIRAHLPA